MPNLVALIFMISDKNFCKSFYYFSVYVAIATRIFIGIEFFEEFLKREVAESFL